MSMEMSEMVSLDEAVIARLDRDGERFEILVDPEMAHKFKNDPESVEITELLAVEEIFKGAHKGDRASSEMLNKSFSTSDTLEVARLILEKGEIQLTTDQRKKMQEEKRKQIVNIISRNCINPISKTPHPPQRIEMAMEEAKINVDPFKSPEAQVNDVLKGLRPLLPIRMEMTAIAIKVPAAHYGKLVSEFRSYGKILREEWGSGGEWMCVVEIPAGLQLEFFDLINSRTHGEASTKIMGSVGVGGSGK